jgi:hypothetical protein
LRYVTMIRDMEESSDLRSCEQRGVIHVVVTLKPAATRL